MIRWIPVFLVTSLVCATAQAEIRLSPDEPVVGRPVTVTLDGPATELKVTYRPNSGVVAEAPIALSQPSRTFTWTPDRAGIVALSAAIASPQTGAEETVARNVSVRFDSFPISGLLVMLFAAVVLFGGAGLAFRILFRDKGETGYDGGVIHHPDT